MEQKLATRALLALALLLASSSAVGARTWRVSKEAPSPLSTIQGGLVSSSDGDTIIVAPGTYNEDIDFLGRQVLMISSAGPDQTILHGVGPAHSVVLFKRNESRSTIIDGFTITGGHVDTPAGLPYDLGGGITCVQSSPVIRNCRITGNSSRSGGGLYIVALAHSVQIPGPLVVDNLIQGNQSSGQGGGVRCEDSPINLIDNQIINNRAANDAGGVDLRFAWGGHGVVRGNVIKDNIAGDHGGGVLVYCHPERPEITAEIEQNIFDHNSAFGGGFGDTGAGGGMFLGQMVGTVAQNTIINNSGTGSTPCFGGGIALNETGTRLRVADNIVAFNSGCGIVCRSFSASIFSNNLVWGNEGGNVVTGGGECSYQIQEPFVLADPMFCALGSGSYAVAESSAALTGRRVIGAVSVPECTTVPVKMTTWGSIKAMFR